MGGALDGKVAVVTGATRGIGKAIAEALGGAGARLVVCGRSAGSVEAAVAGLKARGFPAAGMACDVADLAQVEALADLAAASFGRADIWINNAGLSPPWGPSAHVPSPLFREALEVNIVGTYNGSVTAIRRFLAQGGGGRLVNLTGQGDTGAVPKQNAYSSSKAWVLEFTKALAAEYRGRGIAVNAFNPGMTRTDMLSSVEAIRGWEGELTALSAVSAVLGSGAELPAARLLELLSGPPRLRGKVLVSCITPGFTLARGLRALGRLLSGKGLGRDPLEVKVVEPAAD